jgi:hypothetical protein
MAREVVVKADQVKKRKRRSRVIKLALLFLLLLLTIIYLILRVIYNEGRFTITLDSNETLKSGLAIFESLNNSQGKRKLEATPVKFMDNISYKWLPENIDTEADGPHNGKNYIAYSFYVENQGDEVLNYWYEVYIDDVIKNVDEAVRIRIYRNGEYVTYAKKNSIADEPEEGTVPFRDDVKSKERIVIIEQVKDFKPDDLDRYTIVIWLEGDDPDCVDAIIGGELKMHMKFTEEHIEN